MWCIDFHDPDLEQHHDFGTNFGFTGPNLAAEAQIVDSDSFYESDADCLIGLAC